jgi:hypothetical protein
VAPAPASPFGTLLPAAPPAAWAPPSPLPAQDNWTWTTSDGQTYNNVVITKIDSDTVAITHSLGVAHVPISTLPANIQKQLNYDPQAAAARKAEADREAAHPYYTLDHLADAQAVARQMRWPLAWICEDMSCLSVANPAPGSEPDLTQQAVSDLKTQAIIVFADGNGGLGAMPAIVREQGFFQMDDGPIPGGHHFYGPKIVFSDADLTKVYGRVTHTQMTQAGTVPLDVAVQAITQGTPVPVPVPPGGK